MPARTTRIPHPLAEGLAPAWASAWGRDRYGPWVELELRPGTGPVVSQRLRWVPPGRFLMGSPDTEKGRWEEEGPQHEVTISRGFWLFDTPCTQALWEVVMGANPSRFVDPARPVERVSFEDVAVFSTKLNGFVPGLGAGLPTEAEWEYACRAGTTTSTYAGDVPTLGTHNAPGLDGIAWYRGNSSQEFDLADGDDTSGWAQKQSPHKKAGTRKVRLKEPNGWGLYDMLGNVWQWCRDGKRVYTNERMADPIGSTGAGAERVIRGGCWYDTALLVRSARRNTEHRGHTDTDLGFRCVCSGRS